MIKSLLIKDYALIDEITIEFGRGLNIITGETGAGKSILLGALSLLLGDRASSEIIRKGSAKTVVEGRFSVQNNSKIEILLETNELDIEPELIVRREISAKGNNRCFINDTPVNLNVIKDFGEFLVDLHGQHEHQSLLRTDTHLQVIDDAGNYEDLLQEFQIVYSGLKKLEHTFNELVSRETSLSEKKELYRFQLNEIDSVSPVPDEDVQLEKELVILENSEKLLSVTSGLYATLYEDDGSIHDLLVNALGQMQELARIDTEFLEKAEEFNSAIAILNDVAEFMRSYRDKTELDPARVENVRERLGSLSLLKKKYGGSLESVLKKREALSGEVELAENYSEKIAGIREELAEKRKAAGKIAAEISGKRRKAAVEICRQVVGELDNLGISDAVFEAKINNVAASGDQEGSVCVENRFYKAESSGIDNLEFFISTNKGEDLKPLVKVASGGEISRIMLSLKSVLAKNEKLPLLVFDEIDTGVSGRIAQKVGKSLKSLAGFHQIIAITHLPQIAALADIHFVVEKQDEGERVVSRIRKLSQEESISEVAKLLSGEVVTEASLKSARQLIEDK